MAETTQLNSEQAQIYLEPPVDDILHTIDPATTAPRFLGSTLGDYRPVSGISSFNGSTDGSAGYDDLNDQTSPFVPKDNTYDSTQPSTNYETVATGMDSFQSDAKGAEGRSTTVAARNFGDITRQKRRNFIIGALALVALVIIALAAILGGVFGSRRANSSNEADGSLSSAINSGNGGGAVNSAHNKLWGVGGDTIKMEDGTSFVYNNTLGGTWVSIPLNDTAKPQGDQPALNEPWDYSKNRILGVNLGGWLVLEPFIVPSIFEPFADSSNPAVDEWTLCESLGSKAAETLENHYRSFITEKDFAQIAAAGLNWIRLPVGWWMIETYSGEPFVSGVSFKYFQKAAAWARKYGLRINLDLHAIPGSQNGWNHSGRLGKVGFLNGVMGVANSQRAMNYVRTLAQFISQPQYSNVFPMFSVLNEALVSVIGADAIRSWYYQVYQMLRSIGGIGEGKGPFMAIHDGFGGPGAGQRGWDGFLQGADRLGLDTHHYFCFNAQNTDSIETTSSRACTQLTPSVSQTLDGFGLLVFGEYSLAINDCGLYLNNIGAGSRFEGSFPTEAAPDPQFKRLGSCDAWSDDSQWTQETKQAFADFAAAQQDSMRNSFFWTWKIGSSIKQRTQPNPMWSYLNGLQKGYIRPDARSSNGKCLDITAVQGGKSPLQPWSGTLASWKTGGTGAGNIAPSQTTQYSQFPPAVISGASGGNTYPATALPSYVRTGTPVTLAPLPLSTGSKSINMGSGWAQPADNAKWWVPQSGCNYPDPWNGVNAAIPTPVCGAGQT
ncbi:glycoside hydrolase superfamily [Phakopsora pachyrhizi]|nr:glycoside hydrolase superfamily [Phakopsora pachyrhizi]